MKHEFISLYTMHSNQAYLLQFTVLKLRKRSKRHGQPKARLEWHVSRHGSLQIRVLEIPLHAVDRDDVIPFRSSPLNNRQQQPLNPTQSNHE